MALVAMVWVPWVVAGPGLHDPNCPHHQPGASGKAHVGHTEQAAQAGHAGHGTHAPTPASDAGDQGDQDCHCLGLCIPGALSVHPVATTDVAIAPAASLVPFRPTFIPPAVPAERTPHRLPFATGPPGSV